MKRCLFNNIFSVKRCHQAPGFSAPEINTAVIHCPSHGCLFRVLNIIPASDSKNRLHKRIHASPKWVKTSSFSYGSLNLAWFLLCLYRRWRQDWDPKNEKSLNDSLPSCSLCRFFFPPWKSSLNATSLDDLIAIWNDFSAVSITFNRYYGALFLLGFITY